MSLVSDFPAAASSDANRHFGGKLAFETDCDDVATVLRDGQPDFVLLHVVGTPEAYAKRHIPGAIHLPHREITEERMADWPEETLFVVYCAGPHCNGADKAAFKLSGLGRSVKLMIGGITGWEDEGFPFASGDQPGHL
ncbi:rhodanese-like domain-containing protein [Labrenzia sp. CE80]|uniref:rhodanese-like domain-containing protein n=1 Tax=Labrenzia sp. CE80 TaxID=1788986 RepID=UPI00129BE9B7|nr:rhodanese-like domain-containing protein [Labrenzia sp. CE80]